jgi:FG-GAP repeat
MIPRRSGLLIGLWISVGCAGPLETEEGAEPSVAAPGGRREGTVPVPGLGEGSFLPGDGAAARSSPFWLEEARLFAGDNLLYDNFATAVDVWGDTAVVGARSDEHLGVASGSAYVFGLEGGAWIEGAKLLAAGRADGDDFGRGVAIDGDTIAIGAPGAATGGAVVVFVRAGDTWVEQQTLVPSDGAQGDSFGESVALSGDSIVVGAPDDDDAGFRSGAAYVFVRVAGVWTEEAKLLADDGSPYDELGIAVAIEGDTVVAGAPENHDTSGTLPGSAYVFIRSAGSWTLDATLLPAARAPRDGFGRAVALGGDTIVVGAPWDKDAPVTGYAHVFVRSDQAWVEQQRLAPADATLRKRFGYAVDVLEDIALIGAPMDRESGPETGAAYVFMRSEATWSQEQKLRPSDALPSDLFGATLALTPGRGIVGLHHEDHDLERAFVFRRALVVDACVEAASCATGCCVDGVRVGVATARTAGPVRWPPGRPSTGDAPPPPATRATTEPSAMASRPARRASAPPAETPATDPTATPIAPSPATKERMTAVRTMEMAQRAMTASSAMGSMPAQTARALPPATILVMGPTVTPRAASRVTRSRGLAPPPTQRALLAPTPAPAPPATYAELAPA